MSQVYTVDEVSNHKSDKSAWIIIHNDVYDVTAFLNEHPGGADSLLDVAGTDGTQPFEDVNHSEDARIMMKKYKIGTLPPGECRKFIASCCPPLTKSECDSKTWRTYDGSSGSKSISTSPKTLHKSPPSPRPERRVPSIIVPKERRPRVPPCSPERPDCRLKWALVALAGALIIGFVLKKYTS